MTATAPRPRRLPERVSPRPLLLIGLLLAGAAISGFTILRDIDPFDEGLALQAAQRIVHGQAPYRDFQWAYGPAQPYLLAGLFKVFGVSLLQWRIVRSMTDAAMALTAFVLVARRAPQPIALATWLAVICEMAEPRSADPFPPALLCVLLAILVVTSRGPARLGGGRGPAQLGGGRLTAAAVLTAVAAAFRLDFALYGLVAVAVTIAVSGELSPGPAPPSDRRRRWLSRTAVYLAAAVALIALVYLPFAIVEGPGSLYQDLVGRSLGTGAYWTLPFPVHFHPPAGAGLAKQLKKGLDFYVPLLVVIGFALAALGALLTVGRARPRRSPDAAAPQPPAGRADTPALLCGLAVLGIGLLAYLISRTDEFHVQPLFVVASILLGVLAAAAPRPVGVVATIVLAPLLVHGVANRLSALTEPPAEARLRIAVGDGVTAPPREARAIDAMVALVQARVPSGDPIYVLPRRSDLVRIGDPLIYVLTERSNPTRIDFGLQTGLTAQEQIVSTLAQVTPRVIVRWTDPTSSAREPNLRGRSSAIHVLDRWVAAHYRILRRLYHYDVLVSTGSPARRARS